MEHSFLVILEPDVEDGGFIVRIPAFPHAHTQGETVEDAFANAREIIELEIEDRASQGEPIPASNLDRVVIGTVTVGLPQSPSF